jgi:hypothetical protein
MCSWVRLWNPMGGSSDGVGGAAGPLRVACSVARLVV